MVDAIASFDGNLVMATEASPRALPGDAVGLTVSVTAAEGLDDSAGF